MTSKTLFRVFSETSGLSLSIRETVDIDTPLAFAMSTIVVLAILFEFFIFKSYPRKSIWNNPILTVSVIVRNRLHIF